MTEYRRLTQVVNLKSIDRRDYSQFCVRIKITNKADRDTRQLVTEGIAAMSSERENMGKNGETELEPWNRGCQTGAIIIGHIFVF